MEFIVSYLQLSDKHLDWLHDDVYIPERHETRSIVRATPMSLQKLNPLELPHFDISHTITVKSNRQLISRRHFIREPSCSFEGDVTTEY